MSFYSRYSPIYSLSKGDFVGAAQRFYSLPLLQDLTGYTQAKNTQQSLSAQMDYEQYLRQGNERALADWNRNVGWQGKSIAYPELSYAGQIYRSNTSIARAGFDYDTASANYYGNLPYRTAGLYGIGTKLSRFM